MDILFMLDKTNALRLLLWILHATLSVVTIEITITLYKPFKDIDFS